MSASKANKQRARATAIRAEIERFAEFARNGNSVAQKRIRRLEEELRGLRFGGVSQ